MPRLFDAEEDQQAPGTLVLPGLAAPAREAGYCGLVTCLQAALRACGQVCAYPWLMGLTGAAFMYRLAEGFPPEAAVAGRWRHLAEALPALGRAGRVLETPVADELAAALEGEIIAGRPALALGWDNDLGDWSLIAGLDGEGNLLGHSLSGRGPYARRPAQVQLLVLLGSAVAAGDRRATVLQALARALPLLDESRQTYCWWLDRLAGEQPYGSPPGRLERLVGEQWLIQCLADARDAGYEFLLQAADDLAEEEADLLCEAASCTREIALVIEDLLIPPDVVADVALDEGNEVPPRKLAVIEEIMRQEAELAAALATVLRHAV